MLWYLLLSIVQAGKQDAYSSDTASPNQEIYTPDVTEEENPDGCHGSEWLKIQEQYRTHEDLLRDVKGVSMVSYEYIRDLITYTKVLQNMVQDLVERDIQMTTHILQLTELTRNIDAYVPNYATQTNAKLRALDHRQQRMEKLVQATNNRVVKNEYLIIESGKLSQAATITYSVITLIAILMISVGILLFLSYFASAASADTPFIQRVARTVFSMIPISIINGRTISSNHPSVNPVTSDLPPSYSTVQLDQL